MLDTVISLQLYTELQAKMTELAAQCLRPLAEGEAVAEDKEAIQVGMLHCAL